MAARQIEILLVEDNPADADLTRETFKEAKFPHRLSHAKDGVDALAFLRRQAAFAQAPRPDLILMDLNMPRMDGRELLGTIKADDDLRRIPVIVLTTSKAETDIVKSYNLHANAYVQKPVDLDQFVEVAKAIEQFWFGRAQLAPK